MDYPSTNKALKLANNEKVKALYPKGYNMTRGDLKESILFLNIYYDDLSYTKIDQNPKMLTVDLVSNMGGLLGLFIGISFLSFGELFEVFFEIVFILFDKSTYTIEDCI